MSVRLTGKEDLVSLRLNGKEDLDVSKVDWEGIS